MRIRKRKDSFPLSSFSPVTSSDPLLLNQLPLPVQLHHTSHHDHHQTPPSNQPQTLSQTAPHDKAAQPSDQPNRRQPSDLISGRSSKGWDSCCDDDATFSTVKKKKKKKLDCMEFLQAGIGKDIAGRREFEEDDQKDTNDSRKRDMLSAETVLNGVESSFPLPQGVGRWWEGERAFPLKKRRGSFERKPVHHEITIMDHDHQIDDKKMKTKVNKKICQQLIQNDNTEQDEESRLSELETKESSSIIETTSRKRRGIARGTIIMEGSRCSRVNGRGWRCCQQTLVGYSLCEHHLGKGRLRSMNSFRERSKNDLGKELKTSLNLNDDVEEDEDDDDDDDYDDKKPLLSCKKKRMKLGVVKARSISSLLRLGDTVKSDHSVVTVADHENKQGNL